MAVNGRARALFGLSDRDVGRVFYELEVSYKPVELRSRIDRALSSRRPTVEQDVPWTTSGGQRHHLQIEAVPLFLGGETLGATIAFVDVTDPHEISSQLERARRELETAYEEIQSTVEELETTNEELQSTNEELETTNEELQSTNEELETMNEELQSTNEELAAINTELSERTGQLSQSNAFRESIVESLRAGVIVLDRDLAVVGWNSMSEDLWGLRADEVMGTSVFALDIGLPVAELRDSIRACVRGEADHSAATLDCVNRRGQPVRCRVTCSMMKDGASDRHGVMLFVELV